MIVSRNETLTYINISVGATNLNAIKAKYPLCSKPEYSYLAVGAAGATDLASNSMSVLDTIYAGIDVRMYTYDRTSPELDYYVLDSKQLPPQQHPRTRPPPPPLNVCVAMLPVQRCR